MLLVVGALKVRIHLTMDKWVTKRNRGTSKFQNGLKDFIVYVKITGITGHWISLYSIINLHHCLSSNLVLSKNFHFAIKSVT